MLQALSLEARLVGADYDSIVLVTATRSMFQSRLRSELMVRPATQPLILQL